MQQIRGRKENIIALAADLQDMRASGDAAPPSPPATEPVPGKATTVVSKIIPVIEAGKKQIPSLTAPAETRSIAPIEKRPKVPNLIGDWFYKDTVHGAERTVQAFGSIRNANGEMASTPPDRAADYVPTIRAFEIADTRMMIEIH
jgi:hypothetical protein